MQENVDRIRAVYEEWGRGNFRAGGELFAPDIAFEPLAEGHESLGRDQIDGYMREFLAQWSAFESEAEELLDLGDTILVTERQRGTGKSSGAATEQTSYAIWTFRDGLVVRLRFETDLALAREAAGLAG